jgi:hypothetical protein
MCRKEKKIIKTIPRIVICKIEKFIMDIFTIIICIKNHLQDLYNYNLWGKNSLKSFLQSQFLEQKEIHWEDSCSLTF